MVSSAWAMVWVVIWIGQSLVCWYWPLPITFFPALRAKPCANYPGTGWRFVLDSDCVRPELQRTNIILIS